MEDLITKATEDFVSGMQKSGNFARRQVIALIRAMDTVDGRLISTDRNNQLIDGASIGIQQVAISGTFNSRVNKVVNSIPKIKQETIKAFVRRNGPLSLNTVNQLKEAEASITSLVRQSIGEQSVINEIMTPMISILNQMVVNQMEVDDALRFVGEKIPSLFTQFAHVRVATPLQLFVRDINKIMADSKGLEWFKYSGPTGPSALGNPIRDFCLHKVGGVYLKSEIEAWPAQESPWDGEIPGTNSFSIFINLGGFNCRHDLVPVKSRDVPTKDVNRAKNKGLI